MSSDPLMPAVPEEGLVGVDMSTFFFEQVHKESPSSNSCNDCTAAVRREDDHVVRLAFFSCCRVTGQLDSPVALL